MVSVQCWVLPMLISPDNLEQGKVNQHTSVITVLNLRFQKKMKCWHESVLRCGLCHLLSLDPLLQLLLATSHPSSISRSWDETACNHTLPARWRVRSQNWVSVPLSTLLSNKQSWVGKSVPMWNKCLEKLSSRCTSHLGGKVSTKIG